MSAWLTSNVHRSALTQEAAVRGIIPFTDADRLWQQMTWDNHYALHIRYGDAIDWDSWEDVPLERESVEAPLDPWVILKLISCWGYQCAEFDGWDKTAAHITMEAVAQHICAELDIPFDHYHGHEKYDAAPWGIDKWEEVTA